MITKDSIIDAYLFLRENNHSIPSEVLEFMKRASLDKLRSIELDEILGLVEGENNE